MRTRVTLSTALVVAVPALAVATESKQPSKGEAPLSVRIEGDPGSPYGRLSPHAPPETAQWGQFAGRWDCTPRSRGKDGVMRDTGKATWTWAYILGGHAVQDIYVGHRKDGSPPFRGTGLRIYNPEDKRWQVTWIDNGTSANGSRIKSYEAIHREGEIVMKYVEGDPAWRTVFSPIRDDAFEWRNEPSQAEMTCRRAQ